MARTITRMLNIKEKAYHLGRSITHDLHNECVQFLRDVDGAKNLEDILSAINWATLKDSKTCHITSAVDALKGFIDTYIQKQVYTKAFWKRITKKYQISRKEITPDVINGLRMIIEDIGMEDAVSMNTKQLTDKFNEVMDSCDAIPKYSELDRGIRKLFTLYAYTLHHINVDLVTTGCLCGEVDNASYRYYSVPRFMSKPTDEKRRRDTLSQHMLHKYITDQVARHILSIEDFIEIVLPVIFPKQHGKS